MGMGFKDSEWESGHDGKMTNLRFELCKCGKEV
jgi:hypothetical protein